VLWVDSLWATLDPDLVTCKRCPTTLIYSQSKDKKEAYVGKHETVGVPTQGSEDQMLERPINMGKVMTEAAKIGSGRPTAEPLAGAMLGHNESFGPNDPLIHSMESRGHPIPLCNDVPGADQSGYSTMDGSAVNCRHCLQHPVFIQRNNMFTEMMSPSHPQGERPPVAILHDREPPEDDYGTPLYNHDCEACTYLGHKQMHDLYYCDQGGGSNMSTVIARHGDRGEDYISGLNSARDNELLALAVVRAFRKGLLTDDEMGWL
jgi:hypothetical protein